MKHASTPYLITRYGAVFWKRCCHVCVDHTRTHLSLTAQNVVGLVGVSVLQPPWLVVLEYLQYGDLHALLRAATERSIALTPREQVLFFTHIVTGMECVCGFRFSGGS